jgi:hypothetical protein
VASRVRGGGCRDERWRPDIEEVGPAVGSTATGGKVRRWGSRLSLVGGKQAMSGEGGEVRLRDEDTRGRRSYGAVARSLYHVTDRAIGGFNLLVLI